jgi:hypothetical protein
MWFSEWSPLHLTLFFLWHRQVEEICT